MPCSLRSGRSILKVGERPDRGCGRREPPYLILTIPAPDKLQASLEALTCNLKMNSGQRMTAVTYTFHPETPTNCPTAKATPAGTIFRAVDLTPVQARHFEPDALHHPSVNRQRCDSWGCSVWPSIEAANHGRKVYQRFSGNVRCAGGPKSGRRQDVPVSQRETARTYDILDSS